MRLFSCLRDNADLDFNAIALIQSCREKYIAVRCELCAHYVLLLLPFVVVVTEWTDDDYYRQKT